MVKGREKRRNRADGSVTKKGRHAQSHVGPLNVAGCGRKRRVRIRGDRLGLLRALKQIRKYYLPKNHHGAMWTWCRGGVRQPLRYKVAIQPGQGPRSAPSSLIPAGAVQRDQPKTLNIVITTPQPPTSSPPLPSLALDLHWATPPGTGPGRPTQPSEWLT